MKTVAFSEGATRRQALQQMAVVFAALAAGTESALAHDDEPPKSGEPKATRLFAKELAGHPGEEVSIVLVEFPPGASSKPHRHPGPVFVCVTEGSVELQVEGGPRSTLQTGQVFYEAPGAIHSVARNASATEPAKILAFMVAKTGAPIVLPA
jgi:quercetin dioxygenase-like cupin family protein